MDSEAQDATQSSVSSTSFRGGFLTNLRRSLSIYQKSFAFGIFLSLFIHISAFYGIYVLSKKVFEVINSREKVFRFTLLKDIPGEKKAALAPVKNKNGSSRYITEPKVEKETQNTDRKNPLVDPDASVESFDSSSSGVRDLPVTYPRMSRILGEEGEVVFLLESHGESLSFKKLKSSGFWRLDEAAEKVLMAKSENFLRSTFNEDVERVRFVFRLKEAQSM